MLLLYALAPQWAASSMLSFDRDVVRLLAAGKSAALWMRYRTATGMRLFSPPAVRAERRAMVLAELGRTAAARGAYKEAIDEYGAAVPLRVMLGYAHASFALGDDLAAVPMYRKLLATAGTLPGVERNLAQALVRLGQDLSEALPMLARAERENHDRERALELKLVRALAYAKLGEKIQAELLLSEAQAAQSTAAEALRIALREAMDSRVRPHSPL
jgi:tetratricopeptide (TPR) repeat protein